MQLLRRTLKGIFTRVDDWSDDVRRRLRDLEQNGRLSIVPYMGFGNDHQAFARGRVLQNARATAFDEQDTRWHNLQNAYRLFSTDEVPGARVRARHRGRSVDVISDADGYLDISFRELERAPTGGWQDVTLELLEPTIPGEARHVATGKILVPPASARFGVISDIDDTVLQTGVHNKFKMLLTTVLSNAYTRLPFEGVSAFYEALKGGLTGAESNPVFYVSSSPYNLYELLVAFLEVHEIPMGPVFLRDFGVHTAFTANDHASHKLANIEKVLETYPDLPFVLIGDDGEKDPQIYAEVVASHADRIRAIYIRKSPHRRRDANDIDRLIEKVRNSGSQLVFAPDSAFAAMHAAGEGLIATEALSDIEQCKQRDENAPAPENVAEDMLVS